MPNSSSKESDRRYGKRKSSDEEHYSKSIPNYSNKDKKSSQEVKQPIRSVGEWSEFLSSSGKIYYYNCKTEKAQWDKPEEWEWLLSQEEKLSKNYYSKDYKTNRYRGKYDEDPFDSKQRYDSQRSYPRGSSSFRPNSYNHSYNMNEPPHRPVYNNNNIQSSSISASGGGSGGGGEYYENSSNMSSSSSNDYYNNNYRNYGQANKNEQEKYWNDSRASKSRSMGNNQKMDDLSYKISPSRYPTNNNYNNYDDPANHGNKHFIYQKQHHPSRFENYNEKNLNDQYHSSSMYNNNNNNYYNNNNSNNNPNDIEMREQNRFKYSNNRSLPTEELNENHNLTNNSSNNNNNNNNNNTSRTTSRSKSSNSNMSRSDSSSQRSSGSSSSNENDNNKNNNKKHKKSKKKSRKRSKKQQDGKNSKLKVNNSPIKQVGNKNGENENSNDNKNKNETDSLLKQTDQNTSNDVAMNSQTDHDSNSNKLNNSLKTQKSTEDNNNTKFNSKQSNDDSNKTEHASDKKDLHSLENVENNNSNNSVTNTNQGNNSTTSNNSSASNPTTSNHNSIFMPVLLSTVEDINKYYKPELLTRIAGIDLNQNLNLINSQVFMKHLQCTSLAAELKNYRSLVRFKEIKKTLQEQRLQFLQNQMKEIEELLN